MADTDRFTEADWQLVCERAATLVEQLGAKGARARPMRPLPPMRPEWVGEWEKETGLRLPADFVDLLTKFAGGWWFHWDLYSAQKGVRLQPPVCPARSGGNPEVPLLGCYSEFQVTLNETPIEDEETLAVQKAFYPLYEFEGGGGDYLVLRLDKTPAEVVYLDHEKDWAVGEEQIICRGFGEFLRRWARMGFPACSSFENWVNPQTRMPDDESDQVKAWWAWLADPLAR
jgi:hypothetical protein